MSEIFVLTKSENLKVEILSVHENLADATDKIDNDFNSNHYEQAKKYEFDFNTDTINKAFDAIGSFHIVVSPNFPTYHIWKKDLE